MLDDIVVDNPFLDSVFVDRRGRTGRPALALRHDSGRLIAGTEYMATLRSVRPGGAFTCPSPFESYQFHTWMVNFSRRVSAPDGAFLGAVAGIVKLSSFSDLFDKVNLQSQGLDRAVRQRRRSCCPGRRRRKCPSGRRSPEADLRRFHPSAPRRRHARDSPLRRRRAACWRSPTRRIFRSPSSSAWGYQTSSRNGPARARWLARSAGTASSSVMLLGALRLAHGNSTDTPSGANSSVLDQQTVAHGGELSQRDRKHRAGPGDVRRARPARSDNRRYAEMYGLLNADLIRGVAREALHARLQSQRAGEFVRAPDQGARGGC